MAYSCKAASEALRSGSKGVEWLAPDGDRTSRAGLRGEPKSPIFAPQRTDYDPSADLGWRGHMTVLAAERECPLGLRRGASQRTVERRSSTHPGQLRSGCVWHKFRRRSVV